MYPACLAQPPGWVSVECRSRLRAWRCRRRRLIHLRGRARLQGDWWRHPGRRQAAGIFLRAFRLGGRLRCGGSRRFLGGSRGSGPASGRPPCPLALGEVEPARPAGGGFRTPGRIWRIRGSRSRTMDRRSRCSFLPERRCASGLLCDRRHSGAGMLAGEALQQRQGDGADQHCEPKGRKADDQGRRRRHGAIH